MNPLGTQATPPDPAQERLGFTLFMSTCLHVMVLLGLGFTLFPERTPAPDLSVTLMQHSRQQPDTSDATDTENPDDINRFLQERPTTPVPAPDTRMRVRRSQTDSLGGNLEQLSPTELEATASTLQARLDLHRQEYAQRTRRHTISSTEPRNESEARYLDNWRRQIEDIGNRNYPAQAAAQGIHGTLRLLVALNPDGSVQDIRILRSSGKPLLDEAAIRIVQQAAPFTPFPPELRDNTDVLEIIRTWQFQRGDTFSSY